MSKSVLAKLYISATCADRQSSICLASQYTRRSVLRTGWWHAPMLLSNGSLGCCPPQACHRDSKGPCPLPPAWSYEESTGWHDENKVIITETPNVTMSWTRMIGHCCTMISLKRVHSCNGHFHFEQRNSARNGSDRASDWSYQESTSCHMRKKSFFVP